MITVIDYGAGNLRSVVNAFESSGRRVRVADEPSALKEAAVLILPGVGAFGDGMEGLRKRDLVDALTDEVVGKGKPFLGICLGMQFLASEGLEHGRHAGLGWIGGTVRRIAPTDKKFKVPHIGWNDVRIVRQSGLFEGLEEAPVFYFVHSYYLAPEDGVTDAITSTCWHGVTMAATVERGNIFGVQFHPEKSQKAGLTLLENFLRLAGA